MAYQNVYLNRVGWNRYNVHLWDSEKGYNCFDWQPPVFTPSPYGEYRTLDGRKAKMVRNYNKGDEVFESDVPPETALLIELYGDTDEQPENQRLFVFDIEVTMEPTLPDVDKANNEITSIAYYDSVLDEYGVLITDEYEELGELNSSDYKLIKCENEEELLMKFLTKWEEVNPTIITGWNIDFFDVPYLYRRLKRLFGEGEANRLSPIREIYWNERKERFFIAGVSALDYIQIYKNFTYTQLSNYRLETVGLLELGYGKVDYEGTLDDLKRDDIKKFVEYNLVDVKIVKELEDKLKFLELSTAVCHIGHVRYEDIYHSSKYLEGAIITYLRRNGKRVANNKNYAKNDGGGFAGAYVKEPVPGRYDYIFDLDLTSMYPSIIMSLNISPETKMGRVIDWDFKKYHNGDDTTSFSVELFDNHTSIEMDKSKLTEFLKDSQFTISSNGILYRTDVDGVIPAILRDWFDTRSEFKRKMKDFGNSGDDEQYEFYNKRQHIQKILLNSVYGCLGLRGWRWYDIENALAVTSIGQTVIKFSSDMADTYYNRKLGTNKEWVIYTDTDSTFLSAVPIIKHMYPDIDENDEALMCDKISEVANSVQEFINKSYDVMARKMFNINGEHRFEIKQENIARRGIWVAKKRYVQKIIWENGVTKDEINVKGLDVVRSDFPKVFREFMSEILEDLLNGVEKEIIDKKIVEFKENLKDMDLMSVCKPTGVKGLKKYNMDDGNVGTFEKGTPVHVKSAINYNDFLKLMEIDDKNSPIKTGEKIVWAYMKNNPYGMDSMALKGYDDPKEVVDFMKTYFDYDKMFDRILKSKLLDFYDALNWTSFEGLNLESEKFFSF